MFTVKILRPKGFLDEAIKDILFNSMIRNLVANVIRNFKENVLSE